MYQVVDTDNFSSDYPDEKFVMMANRSRDLIQKLADVLNELYCHDDFGPRFYKVVELPYSLRPGFEP